MTRLPILSLLCLTLISCTPIGLAVTAGTTAGTFAMEERGIKGASRDLALKAEVIGSWGGANIDFTTDLTVIVYNSKAMVTGFVETEEQRARAISLVWQTEGIKDVYNEIGLRKDSSVEDFAHDTWISTKIFTRTTFDSEVLDLNYKTSVQGGVVYIIGLAQNKMELDRFIAHIKSISYVQKVVSHVDVKPAKSMFRPNYDNQKTTEQKS